MKKIKLKDGAVVPCIGQGTWYLGENYLKRNEEIKALCYGIDNDMKLIDTAEMYGDGKSEKLVGEVISKYKRENLFIVSKVYPWNAGKNKIFTACNNSLARMNTKYIDMYLLHWRGQVPLKETVDCMEELVKEGKIKRWGVSNFDTEDMKELLSIKNGKNCCVDQVLYHLGSRGIEYNLLPYLKENNIALMAYCPLAQAGKLKRGLISNSAVKSVAEKHNANPHQILLSFVIRDENIFAIPRSSQQSHTAINRQAAEILLDEDDINILNKSFPAPKHKVSLDIV